MITPEEAWLRIEAAAGPRRRERLPRRRAAGRVLAAPLVATGDLPAADVSALDGFAFDGACEPGAELEVAGTAAAGDPPGARLVPGRAMRIWTGAPVPVGADRVVAIEKTAAPAADRIRILEPPPAGHAIRRRGEVARAGDELLAGGRRLSPAALALAASQGAGELEVFAAPRVGALVTGDEVVRPEERPLPGELRDSHTDYLIAAGRAVGVEVEPLGIAPDDAAALERRLATALADFEVVLTCGGVSAGGADHLRAVLERLGAEVLLHGVAMQPGRPLLVARRGAVLVFGLPGNPASVMVSFRLFVRPLLELRLGLSAAFWSDAERVELAAPLEPGRGRDRFVPARRESAGPILRARPLDARGSHDLAAFGRADLLVRVRPDDGARAAGEGAEAIAFD